MLTGHPAVYLHLESGAANNLGCKRLPTPTGALGIWIEEFEAPPNQLVAVI